MHTCFLLAIGAVLLGTSMATPAQTVYQCTAGGNIAYQDTPCTGHNVKSRKLTLGDAGTASAGTRTTTTDTSPQPEAAVQRTLRSITSQQRVLRMQIRAEEAFMRAEMDAARRQARGLSPDAQRQAVMQAHDKRWPGIQAKEMEVEQLTDAVRRLCPGGAMLNPKHAVCLKD